MPATFSPAKYVAPSAHSCRRSSSTRHRRRHASPLLPQLSNKVVMGVFGALGVAFVVSLLVIAVSLL